MASRSLTIGNTKLPYVLHRSKKRKRTVALSVEPELSLRIIAPLGIKTADVEKIVRRRASWIIRKLADVKECRGQLPPREFVSGEAIPFWGKQYQLRVTRNQREETKAEIVGRTFIVNIQDAWLSGNDLKQEIRFEIALWYKKQARIKLNNRTAYWSKKLKLNIKKLMVANPSKRWGSCDSHNNIRLNWRIVMAPITLVDYVIVHELCHTRHKNHSKAFWQLLGNVMPDYDLRRMRLRNCGGGYLAFG